MRFLLFTLVALQFPVFLFAFKILIIGAGPVGLFSAYKLVLAFRRLGIPLEIVIMDRRNAFSRPQVVRLSPEIATKFDEDITKKLWPNEMDASTFPTCIGELQSAISDFLLKTAYLRPSEFNYFPRTETVTVDNFKKTVDESGAHLVIIATGDSPFTHQLSNREMYPNAKIPRGFVGTPRSKKYQNGICLTFNAAAQVGELGSDDGVIQFYSRSGSRRAQVYTHHDGSFVDSENPPSIFEKMPQSFRDTAKYSPDGGLFLSGKLVGDKTVLSPDELKWFGEYVVILEKVVKELNLPFPKDKDAIKLSFAERKEYYYKEAATHFGDRQTPTIWLGDSLGVSDYITGFTLSRDYFVATHFIDEIIEAQLRALMSCPREKWADLRKWTLVEIVKLCNAHWAKIAIAEIQNHEDEAKYLF